MQTCDCGTELEVAAPDAFGVLHLRCPDCRAPGFQAGDRLGGPAFASRAGAGRLMADGGRAIDPRDPRARVAEAIKQLSLALADVEDPETKIDLRAAKNRASTARLSLKDKADDVDPEPVADGGTVTCPACDRDSTVIYRCEHCGRDLAAQEGSA